MCTYGLVTTRDTLRCSRQGSRSDKRSNGSQWSDAGKEIGQDSRVGNRSGTGTAAASVWAQRSQVQTTIPSLELY